MAISPQGRCAGKAAWDAKRAWRGTAGLGGVETHAGDEGGWQDGVGVGEDDGEGAGGGAAKDGGGEPRDGGGGRRRREHAHDLERRGCQYTHRAHREGTGT